MQEPSSSERIQRVRIGLTGLAVVFLFVLLGTAISRSGEEPPASAQMANGVGNESEPGDPLAELGVAPGQSTVGNDAGDEPAGDASPPQ